MGKYYKLRGELATNSHYRNFYRILRIIGKANYCPFSKGIYCALKIIKERLNNENTKGVSSSEILSLIKEKRNYFFVNEYSISKRSDRILFIIFQLLREAEIQNNKSLQCLSINHLRKNNFCRNEAISDLDNKLDSLIFHSPKKQEETVEEFIYKVRGIIKVC